MRFLRNAACLASAGAAFISIAAAQDADDPNRLVELFRRDVEESPIGSTDPGWVLGVSYQTWGVQDSFSLGTVKSDRDNDFTSRAEPYAFIMNGGVFTFRAPVTFLRETTFNLAIGFGEGDTEIIQRGGDITAGESVERFTSAKLRRYDFEFNSKTRALGDVVALVNSLRYERVRISTSRTQTTFTLDPGDLVTPVDVVEETFPTEGSRVEAYDLYTARTGLEIKVPITPSRQTSGFANFLLAGGYRDSFAQNESAGVIGPRGESEFFDDEWVVGIDVAVGVSSAFARKWRADLTYRLTNYSPLSEQALVGSNQTVQGVSFRIGRLIG
ncbi:MAG: hypothetical protein AAFR11_04780 [Pseudomonadota bacterium]